MADLISRQAAIDALKGLPTWWADGGGYYGGAQPPMVALLDPEDAVSAIENLPSEQPEIIRCKDCKHWREGTSFSYCDKLHGMGVLDALDYMTAEDDYCSMAERREE